MNIPSLLGLARDEACHAAFVAEGAVGSYPAISPLPAAYRPSVCAPLAHRSQGAPNSFMPQAVCFLLRSLSRPRVPASLAGNKLAQGAPGRYPASRSP